MLLAVCWAVFSSLFSLCQGTIRTIPSHAGDVSEQTDIKIPLRRAHVQNNTAIKALTE